MADAAADQKRYISLGGNTAGRVNGWDHRVSGQNHRIDFRERTRRAQVVLRQPFTDSIESRQRGMRQNGKMGLNHGELLTLLKRRIYHFSEITRNIQKSSGCTCLLCF